MQGEAKVIKYAVGATLMLLVCSVATESVALQIDARCAQMRDKIGCTCALQNGGRIVDGTRWASARGTRGGRPTNQAFTQCVIDNKGH